MNEAYKILHGDALTVLKGMDAESVQCVITSPPYYGLRSYGTTPQVWGNHNGCSHQWGESIKYAKEDKRTPEQKAALGASVGNSVNSLNFAVGTPGNFCLNCNAWRGELGLEPTFTLYISHLIDIFREVKRVLKPTGTVWVNLGDSFSGSPTGRFNGGSDIFKGRDLSGHARSADIDKSAMGIRPKSLMNIPSRFAIAMTENPYTLRPELSDEQRVYVVNELVKRGII
jgi:DNA modification methylase